MTYPPQQPGGWDQGGQPPNPYGQQPGGQPPYGQSQQGGWNQGGQPQSGGFPSAPGPGTPGQGGPYQGGYQQPGGPQQYGQQPDQYGQFGQQPGQFGQPGQPGQPGGPFGQQPGGQFGGFGEEPPKKKKTGLIVGLAIGAVVLLGGATGLVIWLTGDSKDTKTAAPASSSAPAAGPQSGGPSGSSSSSPTSSGSGSGDYPAASGAKPTSGELFQAASEAYNSSDTDGLYSMLCTSLTNGQKPTEKMPSGIHFELTSSPQENGDQATVKYHVTMASKTADGTLTALRQGGAWCLGKVSTDH